MRFFRAFCPGFNAALLLLAAGVVQFVAAPTSPALASAEASRRTRGQDEAPPQAPAQQPPAQHDNAIFQNPIPAPQLSFLTKFAGMESDKVIRDQDYRRLLKKLLPNCEFHYGYDMPLSEAVDIVIKGSRQPAQIRNGRYMMISGQSGPYLLGRGFIWIDMQDGIALGGFYFHPTNGEPTPAVNNFSPPVTTRYFITGDKKKIVLQHDEDYCAPTDGSISPAPEACQQMNADAADIDVEAAYYVDSTGHSTNATAWMLNPAEFSVWVAQRNASCIGPDPLACRIRLAREHVRVIINRHPLPPPPPRR